MLAHENTKLEPEWPLLNVHMLAGHIKTPYVDTHGHGAQLCVFARHPENTIVRVVRPSLVPGHHERIFLLEI